MKVAISSTVFCLGFPFLMVGGVMLFIAWSLFNLAIKISDPEVE